MWSKPASIAPGLLKWSALFAIVYVVFGILFYNVPLAEEETSVLWIILGCVALFGPLIMNVVFSLIEEFRCLVGLTTFLIMVFGLMPFFNDLYLDLVHKAYYIYLIVSYIGLLTAFWAGGYHNAVTIKIRKIYQISLLDLLAFVYYANIFSVLNAEKGLEQALVFIFPLVLAVVLTVMAENLWGCLGFIGLIAFGICFFYPELYTSLISIETEKIKVVVTIGYFILTYLGSVMSVLFAYETSYRRKHKSRYTPYTTYTTPSASRSSSKEGRYTGDVGGSLDSTYTGNATPQRSHTDPGPAGSFCGMNR